LTLAWAQSASAEDSVTAAADSLRTSWYPDEAHLTPQLLEASGGFDRNFSTPVQGQVYAQPLSFEHTLFTATENDWIYGIDSQSGEVKWERSVGTPWNSADIGCGDLAPHVGITGTPVIDPKTNTVYFFAKSYVSATQSGPAVWKMHAVDLANGEERQGFPVTISGEAQNLPGLVFNPTQLLQRPALLLMNGVVYAGFGSHCDTAPFQGWLVGVSTAGQVKVMWATTEHDGAAIWQSGGGLISDREGQMLFATGNSWSPSPGPGSSPPEGHLGDSVVRVQVESDGSLAAKDFFSPYNNLELDAEDLDLGSGAPLALPSPYFGTEAFPHLLVQVGKTGVVYLLNRDELGGMGQGPAGKNADIQESTIQNGVWGSLATWPGDGGYVYIPAAAGLTPQNGALEFLEYGTDGTGRPELTPVARATGLEFGSGSPIVTSDGATPGSGIVWVSQCPESPACEESTLDAYAAVPTGGTPDLLWSGEIGVSTKFARPDASEGRIYVGTRDGHILAFGATHHMLTVSRDAAFGGSVRSGDEGIDCGSTCAHSFADGATVTLTATPAEHFEFAGWSGGGCSGAGQCQLRMYSDTEVKASFAPITHMVTISKVGGGDGTVVSRPPGIECGGSCSARFAETSNVVLEAIPGSSAVTWGDCTRADGRVCEVDDLRSDSVVTASFLPLPDTLLAGAKIDRKKGKAVFRFRGTAEPQAFQCRLIGPAGKKRHAKPQFAPCTNPKTFRHLSPGRYTFQVRATNASGPDPTAVSRRFRI
jgi:outer membrane protein assembly factor BamB